MTKAREVAVDAMSSAVERLAAQLMNLSNEEWARVTQRWLAGQDWNGIFGPAWDEISERLIEIDRGAAARSGVDQGLAGSPLHAQVRSGEQR